MSILDVLKKINRGIAWVQVKILTPILVPILWIVIGISCVLPRVFGAQLLIPFRRGGETHWLEHDKVDTSMRGMKRQG